MVEHLSYTQDTKVRFFQEPPNYMGMSSFGMENALSMHTLRVRIPSYSPDLYGRLAQLVRALACHARGRGFESLNGRHICLLGSMVERLPDLQEIEVQFF